MTDAPAAQPAVRLPPPAVPHWANTLASNTTVIAALVGLVFLGRWVEDPDAIERAYPARMLILAGINITLAVSLQLINGISGQFSLGHAGFMALGAYLAGYATRTYGVVTTEVDGDPIPFDFHNPRGVIFYFVAVLAMLAIVAIVLGGIAWLVGRSGRLHKRLPPWLTLVVVVWAVADIGGAPVPHVWSAAFNAGVDGFNGLVAKLTGGAPWGALGHTWSARLTMFVALLGGGLVAAVAGLVVGLPTLRLRGDYLAIATLGFAEIIRVAITNAQPFGGATGLQLGPWATAGDDEIGLVPRQIFPWVYGTAVVTTLVVWRLKRSPKGRALQAVRDDEVAAAAIGIDTTHHKVLAFVIGAFFAGVAGALFAHYDAYLTPGSFGFLRSVEVVVMVTLGGLGSIPGAIMAAVVLTLLPEVLRSAPDWVPPGTPKWALGSLRWVGEQRMVVYSLLLIVIMVARARGWFSLRRLRHRGPRPEPASPITGAPAA
ncbi:MAG TPA: branched-chain amino acid ABC transporter permease [Tepidisphaeraceae bacterium]|nr:branched-chain amino acid ABC transporter permease [Tepidisphaeraceae bacterium]